MDLIALVMSIPGIGPYVPYLTLAVTICAAAAVAMPSPKADSGKAYQTAYAVVQWIALNKGHAVALSAPSSAGIVGGPGAVSAPRVATSSIPATLQGNAP